MTRWARARGSKGANEKLPEDATDWLELKKGVNQEEEEEEYDIRQDDEGEIDRHKGENVWADIPRSESDSDSPLELKNSSVTIQQFNEKTDNNKRKKKNKKNISSDREQNLGDQQSWRRLQDNDTIFQEGNCTPPFKSIKTNSEDIVLFEGFRIRKDDAHRIIDLKKSLIKKGVARNEVEKVVKLERRKAEKTLRNRKVCFQCRELGHILAECPRSGSSDLCYNCGSTEHLSRTCKEKPKKGSIFKFATCFICKEEGHIARECPDNPRGIYPNGGACSLCGDVTHFKKHCPIWQKRKAESNLTLKMASGSYAVEDIDDDQGTSSHPILQKKPKVVKI